MTEKDLDVAIEMCERIMEFDTRTMKDPVSENGFLFDSVYDLLKFLRQFQFATDTNVSGDLIDRQAVIDALADAMPSLTTPDGCGQFDHDIQVTDEAYVDCMRIVHDLPSAQPEIIHCKECKNSEHWYRNIGRCFLWSEDGVSVFDDGFCNYAERRTDGRFNRQTGGD